VSVRGALCVVHDEVAGVAGVNGGPPALRNAIYAATGVALRRMPIDRSLIAAGKKA